MKTTKPILPFILSLQLLTGCQSGGGGTTPLVRFSPPTPEETPLQMISIEGTISKITNLLFSSAHAADGVLILKDYTQPETPIEIEKIEIREQNTFSFSVARNQIANKLLKIEFSSSSEGSLSRQILLTATGNQNTFSAELSAETTARAILIEAILKKQMREGLIDPAEMPANFESQSALDIGPLIELVGLESLITLLKDPSIETKTAEAMLDVLESKKKEDPSLSQQSLQILADIHQSTGLGAPIYINCEGNAGRVSFNNGPYEVTAKGVQESVMKKFGGALVLGRATNWEEGNKYIYQLVEILSELSNYFGENLQAMIYFQSENGDSASCLLSGKDLHQTEYLINPSPLELSASFESLEEWTFNEKATFQENQSTISYHFIKILYDYVRLLEGAAMDPIEKKILLKKEFQRGFSILFSKIKVATELQGGETGLMSELDLTAFESYSDAKESIVKAYESDMLQPWYLELAQWYHETYYH